MARPRETGGLAEASKLLQEGLQLLAEREREVDRLLEHARERALLIREEAEARAAQITSDAETQRTELESLVATLRTEVEALREELAELRKSGAQASVAATEQPAPAVPLAAQTAVEPPRSVHGVERETAEPDRLAQETAETDAPRWGRPSAALSGDRAVRPSKAGRRRWLSPWLALLVILLVAAAILATRLNG